MVGREQPVQERPRLAARYDLPSRLTKRAAAILRSKCGAIASTRTPIFSNV
jgi:hypothetical protein